MQILTKYNNSDNFLRSLNGKAVIIVSAFASGTEKVIDCLVNNSNSVELIVGTNNSFSSPNFLKHWLKDEVNQQVPLFVWEKTLSKEKETEAHEILERGDSDGPSLGIKTRDIFTCPNNKGELPYAQGDVVLCLSGRGGHIGFYSFDRIIGDKGTAYMYSYKNRLVFIEFIRGDLFLS